MGGFTKLRIGMLEGDMNTGYVSVGNGISFIHEIRTVHQIIATSPKTSKQKTYPPEFFGGMLNTLRRLHSHFLPFTQKMRSSHNNFIPVFQLFA